MSDKADAADEIKPTHAVVPIDIIAAMERAVASLPAGQVARLLVAFQDKHVLAIGDGDTKFKVVEKKQPTPAA